VWVVSGFCIPLSGLMSPKGENRIRNLEKNMANEKKVFSYQPEVS